jgi:glycosyltransferase involved in cell wall biosynthesis
MVNLKRKELPRELRKILLITNLYPSDQLSFSISHTYQMVKKSSSFEFILAVNRERRKNPFWLIYKYSNLLFVVLSKIFINFDLIEVHYIIPTGLFGLLVKVVRRKPLLSVVYGSDLDLLPGKKAIFRYLARLILRNSDLVVVFSLTHRKKLIAEYNLPPSKIFWGRPGPQVKDSDFSKFDLIRKATNRLKKKKLKKKKLLLFIGKNRIKRGVDFIKSLSYLDSDRYVGMMIIDSRRERKKVSQLIKREKINNLFLLPGLPNKLVLAIMASSDILIIPSLSESLCLVGLESILAGCPIIATRVGEIKKYLKPGKNGFFVDKKNPRQIGQKVKKLIDRHEHYLGYIRKNRHKVLNDYYFPDFLVELNRRRESLIKK